MESYDRKGRWSGRPSNVCNGKQSRQSRQAIRVSRSRCLSSEWPTRHALPPIAPGQHTRWLYCDARKRGIPIVISARHINDTRLLQLPGECFIQDQLRAQQIGGSSQFVATATCGDQGPWYVPIREEYSHGGYEVSIAFCGPKMDDLLTRAMKSCLV